MTSYDRLRNSIPRIIPEKAHPLVQKLFREMNRQGVRYVDIENRAGVSVNTLRKWRRGQSPQLQNLVACLDVVNRKLVTKMARRVY